MKKISNLIINVDVMVYICMVLLIFKGVDLGIPSFDTFVELTEKDPTGSLLKIRAWAGGLMVIIGICMPWILAFFKTNNFRRT